MKTYKQIANSLLAQQNCKKNNNTEWFERHGERIEKIMQTAPSGSGFDSGTEFSEDSKPERLIFTFGYHHMNEDGFYTHWTHHKLVVTGSLVFDFNTRLTTEKEEVDVPVRGWPDAYKTVRRRPPVEDHDLDYFHEVFEHWLNEEWEPSGD